MLGDSLSAGYGLSTQESWVHQINQYWLEAQQPLSLINASISGETTDAGLARLPTLIKRHEPQWLIIELGANDGLRGFSLNLIKQNLIQLIRIAKENNIKPILFAMQVPPNYGNRYSKRFSQLFYDVAKEYAVPVVPLFIESVVLDPALMQADGLHPNAKAQPIIAEKVRTTLEAILTKSY